MNHAQTNKHKKTIKFIYNISTKNMRNIHLQHPHSISSSWVFASDLQNFPLRLVRAPQLQLLWLRFIAQTDLLNRHLLALSYKLSSPNFYFIR